MRLGHLPHLHDIILRHAGEGPWSVRVPVQVADLGCVPPVYKHQLSRPHLALLLGLLLADTRQVPAADMRVSTA